MEEGHHEDTAPVRLSPADVQLVLTALRFLLSAEDDAQEIERIKRLIDRLEA